MGSERFATQSRVLWSIQQLQEGEAVLISLARKVRNLKGVKNAPQRQLKMIHEILADAQQEQRQQAEMAHKSLSSEILQLEELIQALSTEIAQKITNLTEGEIEGEKNLNHLDLWIQKAHGIFHKKLSDLEEENSTFTQTIGEQEQLLEQKSVDLHELEISLKQLMDDDLKLKKPDRTNTLEKNIASVQTQFDTLLKKSGQLTGIKNPTIKSHRSKLQALQKEFNLIIAKSEALNSQFPHLKEMKKTPGRSKRAADSELTELDRLIEKVKNIVTSKQKLIHKLQTIEKEIEEIQRQKQMIQSDLEIELTRLKRQTARNHLIAETTKKRDALKSETKELENSLRDLHSRLRETSLQQQSILEEQESVSLQYELIQELQRSLTETIEALKNLKQKRIEATASAEIWYNTIMRRIMRVRREINIGPFPLFLFFPRRAIIRYQTGLYLRRDVILAERALGQLGFLDPAYLTRVDIFNRANRHHQQLSIDILNCSR